MESQDNNDPTGKKSDQESISYNKKAVRGPKPRKKKILLGTSVFVIGLTLLQFFDSHLHKFLFASVLMTVGSVTLWLELQNFEATKKGSAIAASIVFAIAEVTCLFLFVVQPQRVAKPHFKVVVTQSDAFFADAGNISLTNSDVLFVHGWPTKVPLARCLLVPFGAPFTNASLKLRLMNDSPVPVESARLLISFDSDFVCVPSTGEAWPVPWTRWRESGLPGKQVFSIAGSMSMLPGEGAALPDLNFLQPDQLKGRSVTVVIASSAKDISKFYILFQIVFYPATNSATLRFVKPEAVKDLTNNGVVFRIPN